MTYGIPTVTERGFSNLVNALSAISRFVFTEGTLTLEEIRQALESDFEGHESLRERLVSARKWGTDDDDTRRWALRWMEVRDDALGRLETDLGSPPHLMAHVVRSLHHVDGAKMGATPDGRRAGEPLAASIGLEQGTRHQGPTALLNSVGKLEPSVHWTGGYNLNLSLPPSSAGSLENRESLCALIETFFAQGGQELQINFLDSNQLKDACAHPEKYPDLLVRVAGFNARFIHLSPVERDEIIRRAEEMEQASS